MRQGSPLLGGRTTAGVVRIGDTVRRPARSNSEFVRALLLHLAEAGFEGAPKCLGVDEQGRDSFSYLKGEVPADLGPFEDRVLVAAARLIRSYHDATAAFAGSVDVVCHNDLSPCNAVFVSGIPVGLIDFDAVAPGTRLWDLGYAAWLWLDIGNREVSGREQLRRLRLFAGAYDPELAIDDVLETMLARQQSLMRELGDPDRSTWAADCFAWTTDELGRGGEQ
jgi:hypothetical protein